MRFTRESKIGLTALIALILLIWGINYLKGISIFKSTVKYYAVYSDVTGIPESAVIYLNGYKVGNVSKIQMDRNSYDRMILELSISKKIPLPLNTIVVSSGADLISGQKDLYLALANGSVFHESGDTLITSSETGLFDIIDPFISKFENIVISADSLLLSLNLLMNDKTRYEFQGSVSSLNATMASLEKTLQDDGSLTKTLSNFESISENIKNNNENINIMLNNLAAISDTLKDAEVGLLLANLENTLKETSAIFERLNEGEGSAGQFLTNDSLYRSLNSTVTSLDSLLTDLKANPGRYVRFSLFGGKNN